MYLFIQIFNIVLILLYFLGSVAEKNQKQKELYCHLVFGMMLLLIMSEFLLLYVEALYG